MNNDKLVYFSYGLILAGFIVIGSEYAFGEKITCEDDIPELIILNEETSFDYQLFFKQSNEVFCYNEFGDVFFMEPKEYKISIFDDDYDYLVYSKNISINGMYGIHLQKDINYKVRILTFWSDVDRTYHTRYIEDNYNNLIEDTGFDYVSKFSEKFLVPFESQN